VRKVLVVLSTTLAVLAAAAPAGAEISSSQITSPAGAYFTILEEEVAAPLRVTGTTSGGTAGDKVDLACYYNGDNARAIIAFEEPLKTDGSFEVQDPPGLSELAETPCHLHAIPAGEAPSDLSPFAGPVMAVGRRSSDSTVPSGPNGGDLTDFSIYGQTPSAGNSFDTLSECGFSQGRLYNDLLEETTRSFVCNAWFAWFEDFAGASTRSQLRIDGVDSYGVYAAREINPLASGFPVLSYSYSQNPSNGDVTIHNSEQIVTCLDSSYPPEAVKCSSYLDSGIRIDRTIEQTHGGHLVTISDRYVSTDGQSHTLDLLPENQQSFGNSGEELAYRFPGESSFATHEDAEVIPFSDAVPGAIFVHADGVADGDTSTGQGAIVFDRPASPATFNRVDLNESALYFHQTGAVPAAGSTSFRFAYAQAYGSAEVEALAQQAEASFKPQLPAQPGPAPKPVPVLEPRNEIVFGRATANKRNGTVRLSLRVFAAGAVVLTGKKVRTISRRVSGPTTLTLTVRPKRQLFKALFKRHRAKVTVRVTFTPNGGSARSKTRKLVLIRR
jgi:hypothetical protein